MPDYTPTEGAILKILSDGYAHKREELRQALPDELSGFSCLSTMLYQLRKKLKPMGQDIVCQLQGRRISYRWVRTLSDVP